MKAAALGRKGYSVPAENQSAASGGWMVHAMYFSMGLRHDYRGALRQVDAPVLVIHGEKDLQPEEASRMYAQAFPNAEFKVIGNASHFAFSEQPEEFAAAVGGFLSKIK